MSRNRTTLFGTSALAGLAAFGVLATPALAQTAGTKGAPEATTDVEEVVVTGSLIRRDPATSPTPLIALTGEEILQSGEPNIVDFLADVPALSGSIVPEDTTGSNLNDGGLSLLNLRDLGTVRTLVLVDGRRHVGSSPGTLSVDVDTIPSALVESVEIVTGGQSALYGADAVSGVVNFILKKDFEGLSVDGSLAEINQDGQQSKRLSVLAGHNFLDDRLNVYAFAEHQVYDEVTDFDIDYRREAWGITANDADPTSAPDDGDMDNILLSGRRDANYARGGLLMLASQPQPSATNDPDVANSSCASSATNCWNVGTHVPGKVFVFNPDGTARPFNYGTFQPQTGYNRRINVGGDGLNTGTEFGQTTRVPESENDRFQVGVNFNITDDIRFFGEVKHVKEQTYDAGQPTFFSVTLRKGSAGGSSLSGSSSFNLNYQDNAFLDPAIKTLIDTNTRPTYAAPTAGAPSVQTGTVADSRALLGMFGPSRSQLNNRELTRYVVGLDGSADKFLFIDNFAWNVGYTYGEMKNSNKERGVDSERFFYAADAVVDTGNVLGHGTNYVACRSQIQTAAAGSTIPNVVGRDGGAPLNKNDPAIAGCTPISIFGTDFRSDANNPNATGGGGRQGLTAAQANYLLAEIEVTDQNRQHDLMGYVSGELWDLWGAGPIGVALGAEYRKEETEGTGRDRDTRGRLLFLNTGPDFPEASYDAKELFTEVRLPIFTDVPNLGTAELTGAYRISDYSTVGEVETYSFTANYRPNDNFFLRATAGQATRIPNLGENFRPATGTFGNSLTDPCSPDRIRSLTSLTAAQRDKLRANCLATMPAGYNPGTDTAGTGSPVQINYGSGIPGFNVGNPDLKPEQSRSYTIGGAFTPTFLPGFAFSADYYDIKITDVISSVTVQQAMNNCVGLLSGSVGEVDPAACASITRSAATQPSVPQQPPFGIYSFRQQSFNYAATLAKGIDFSAHYGIDLADIFDKDLGRLNWSIRGNYLIKQVDYTNIAAPWVASPFDSTVGLPRVRFLSTLNYRPNSKLSFSWDWDWQASQEIIDPNTALTNGDNREMKYFTTGAFSQHDFTVRWNATDSITLRGGVVNAFDEEPAKWLGSTTSSDNFDLFGRRMFVGINYRY